MYNRMLRPVRAAHIQLGARALCVYVYVCACARAGVHVCIRACACVRIFVCARRYPPSPTPYRYLNSGTWIGRAGPALAILRNISGGGHFGNGSRANDQAGRGGVVRTTVLVRACVRAYV